MNNNVLVRLENVYKTIDGVEIMKDINLTLSSGKIVGFYGKNGSGKTMLMRIICGLVRPSSGQVIVNNKLLGKNIDFIPNVGVMLEMPGFIEHYSAIDNLISIAEIKGIISKKEIEKLMEYMGLEEVSKVKIRKYSLGMRQKVGIISAVMENPDVIILDEPYNALDKESIEKVSKMLLSYKQNGKLIIIACHDKNEMDRIADDVYCLEQGRIMSSYHNLQE